jgi:hypothetical protein
MGGDSCEIIAGSPDLSLLQMQIEVWFEGSTRACTPSLMTIPAPLLPVVAASCPITLLKYPEICPGQNATLPPVIRTKSCCNGYDLTQSMKKSSQF